MSCVRYGMLQKVSMKMRINDKKQITVKPYFSLTSKIPSL